MKRLIFFAVVFSLVVWVGCSKNGGPTTPTPIGPVRVVANTSVGVPAMDSANEPIWSGVTKFAVDISPLNAPKLSPPTSLSLPDSVYLQAIVTGSDLYIRIEYTDDSLNLLKNYWYCQDAAKNFTLEPLGNEDQLFVMLFGLPNSAWDVWNWRSLETAPARLAEGYIYRNDSLIRDAGNQVVAFPNPLIINDTRPLWCHLTGSAFTGEILYINERDLMAKHFADPWSIGQVIPGYYIDSAVGTRVLDTSAYFQSRWDIEAVHSYNSTANRLAVVLRSKLNSPYSDDLDLVDSVKVKVGVLDEQDSLNPGGSRRGFTKEFWLIL